MSWLDELVSYGQKAYEVAKPVVDTAWNFAKENPTLTGAGLGLITGGGTGDYGSNNLRNTVLGGAAGWGLGQMFGGSSAPQMSAAGSITNNAPSAGASWSPSGGAAALITPTISNAAPAVASGATEALGAVGSAGIGVMDGAQGLMSKASEFGKKYRGPLEVGMKGVAAYMDYQRGKENEELAKRYADEEMRGNAANEARVNAQNAAVDDVYKNQKALIGSAGTDAMANGNARTSRALAQIDKTSSGRSSTATAALKRQAQVSGTQAAQTNATGATYNAMAGLRAPSYTMSAAPNTGATNAYGNYARNNTQTAAKDAMDFGRDVFGWNEQDKTQVNGGK